MYQHPLTVSSTVTFNSRMNPDSSTLREQIGRAVDSLTDKADKLGVTVDKTYHYTLIIEAVEIP